MGTLPKMRLITILFILIRTVPPILGVDNNVTSENNVNSTIESSGENVTSLPIENTTFSSAENNSTEEALPLAPQKLQQSPLSSLLSAVSGGNPESSESLQNFLKSRGFSFPTDPLEMNKLLSRLSPKQGRFDPALLDIINNKNIPQGPKKKLFSSTEKNSWTPIPGVVTKAPLRRFSSKFQNLSTTAPPPETLGRPPNQPTSPPPAPFSHITDPNLRNHRLFQVAPEDSLEFETYENFTHIDQAEDLLAQSSEGVPPTYVGPPQRRPVSMEGTDFDSSGDLNNPLFIPSDTFLKFDSEEPFNLLRPREPLRESSTENLIFTHDKYKENFRPSPQDKGQLSPPVFVDPDQDFFTSTIRNDNNYHEENFQPKKGPHPLPPLLRKRNNNKYSEEEEQSNYNKRNRNRKRPVFTSEEAITSLDRDPRPYPPPISGSDEHRDRPKNAGHIKSDRILNSPSENHPEFYNPYGPASNEENYEGHDNYPENNYQEQHYQQHPSAADYTPAKSGLVLGHNDDEIYSGGYETQFHHPFAESDSQPEYSHYPPNSNEGWTNTYWILGGLIALSAVSAFLLPTLLNSMGRNGKIRNDLEDIDNNEYLDEQTSSSSSITSLFSKKPSQTTTTADPTLDTDLWTEIKGVYNDVVKIVRGDYGGIVHKLSNSKDKDKSDGPNIVYRDQEDTELDRDDLQDIEDELDIEEDYGIRNRKKLKSRRGKNGAKKNKTINSSINYVVTNDGKEGGGVETSRGVPFNDTMATFYLGGSSSRGPFSLFPSQQPSSSPAPSSSDGFMGEWAKVQLIGN